MKIGTVDPGAQFLYWLHFIVRHGLGPQHGPYGPRRLLKFQRYLENRILLQSKSLGPAPTLEVPRFSIENLSKKDFERQFMRLNRPVVLEGMARNWPATRHWTLDYF